MKRGVRFNEELLAQAESDVAAGAYATQKIREIETPYIYGDDGAELLDAVEATADGSSSSSSASASTTAASASSGRGAGATVGVKLSAKEGGRYAIDVHDLQSRLEAIEVAQRAGIDLNGSHVSATSRVLRRADLDAFAARKRAFYRDEASGGAMRHVGDGMWIQLASRTTGDLFWCHTGTKAVQWERPEGVVAVTNEEGDGDAGAAAAAPAIAATSDAAAVDPEFSRVAFNAIEALRKDAKKSAKKRKKLRAGLKRDFGAKGAATLAAWTAEHQSTLFPEHAAAAAAAAEEEEEEEEAAPVLPPPASSET